MKKQILLPTSFFFCTMFVSFLIGWVVSFGILFKITPESSYSSSITQEVRKEVYSKMASVNKIIDGDTIEIKFDRTDKILDYYGLPYDTEQELIQAIRYLGIDAPEDHYNSPDPSFYASEALEKNRQMIEGKKIRVEWEKPDDWKPEYRPRKRIIAYVYVKDGDKEIFVNEEMIRSGCASIYRRNRKDHILEHKYSEHFATLEQEAKSKRLGIWDIQAKIEWSKKNGIAIEQERLTYVAYEGYFHREGCPRLSDSNIKKYRILYFYLREKALQEHYEPCKICTP